MIDGSLLFRLKDTQGLPLDFSLDIVLNRDKSPVDWPSFIEEARRQGWWDFKTHQVLMTALLEAQVPEALRNQIEAGFKNYVLANPLDRSVAQG